MSAPCFAFGGADPGRWGGVCRIEGALDGDDLRVSEVVLAPMPVLERDGGGHEVDERALADIVGGRTYARFVIERPAAGGAMQRGATSVVTQGAIFGQAKAALRLARHGAEYACHVVEETLASVSTRRELGLPTVPRGGDRKAANVADAEALLSKLRDTGCRITGLSPARGYAGLIGGSKEARSGMADALLLAWVGVRRWLGEGRRKR